jgi:hypothetical protein
MRRPHQANLLITARVTEHGFASNKVRLCGVLIDDGFLVRVTFWAAACSKLAQALGTAMLRDTIIELRE